ncbi:unnamed protein product [Brassicogethes aeneus]|uniref:Uncharacterized protein n=1 Tax=Brassicogethes aeneus TaxID=1431903 RepID=A0A9P0BE22_BRAAE|nr:unnamed protein product [Brassicogethes aeneus]
MESEKAEPTSDSTEKTSEENQGGDVISSKENETPAKTDDEVKSCNKNDVTSDKKKEVKAKTLNNSGKLNTSGEQEVVDVPDAFFDDFLDNDFMEGLDIVDDVDDEDNETEKAEKKAPKKEPKSKPKPKSQPSQRDPLKTKRDMENYQIKYNKDKQMKLISQRLDSGLVPPGMEMDIEAVEQEMPSDDLREKIKQLKSKGVTEEGEESKNKQHKSKSSKTKKRISPGSYSKKGETKSSPLKLSPGPIQRKKSPLVNRKRSPLKKSPIDKRNSPTTKKSVERRTSPLKISPKMASRERSRTINRRSRSLESPDRRRRSIHSRSPLNKRQRSPEKPFYKAKFPKLGRPSPPPRHFRRSRSRSPDRRRRNFRDFRDLSPVRRRSRSRSRSRPRDPKKYKYVEKSFLEEIAEKLNGIPSQFNNRMQMNNVRYPVPAAAPSNVVYPPIQQNYDQQFFLGNTNLNPPQNVMGQVPMSTAYPMQHNMMQQYPPQQQQMAQHFPTIPLNPSSIPPITKPNVPTVQKPAPTPNIISVPSASTQNRDLAKLYEQKKISLSDYLCISSRPEVQTSNPEQLKEKIKVISRCQDAVKFLDVEKKYSGKLAAKSSLIAEVPTAKYKSPLLRNHKNSIPFTTPPKKIPPGQEFSAYLERLLAASGFKTTAEEEVAPSKEADEESPSANAVKRMRDGQLSKMIQTEPAPCKKCELHKRKTFATVGVQCGESQTGDAETQVTEDDLLPKKRSLAGLTPAQLLGKKKEEPRNNFRYSPSREDARAPPPRTFQPYNPMMQQGNPYGAYGPYGYGRF